MDVGMYGCRDVMYVKNVMSCNVMYVNACKCM